MDGTHTAGFGAGALHLDDGVVGAGAHAAAALDAQVLVNMAFAVAEADGLFGADFLAGMGQTALAHGRHLDELFGTLVAGELDDVDQRRLIKFVRHHAVFQVLSGGNTLIQRTEGKAHGQSNPLRNNGSFQENAAAKLTHFAGNDLVGQIADVLGVIRHLTALVGHPGHFGKHLAADIGDRGINASHSDCSLHKTWQPHSPGPGTGHIGFGYALK